MAAPHQRHGRLHDRFTCRCKRHCQLHLSCAMVAIGASIDSISRSQYELSIAKDGKEIQRVCELLEKDDRSETLWLS